MLSLLAAPELCGGRSFFISRQFISAPTFHHTGRAQPLYGNRKGHPQIGHSKAAARQVAQIDIGSIDRKFAATKHTKNAKVVEALAAASACLSIRRLSQRPLQRKTAPPGAEDGEQMR